MRTRDKSQVIGTLYIRVGMVDAHVYNCFRLNSTHIFYLGLFRDKGSEILQRRNPNLSTSTSKNTTITITNQEPNFTHQTKEEG